MFIRPSAFLKDGSKYFVISNEEDLVLVDKDSMV
jgi:hypothetical protein